jgi:hypothetical protein
MFITYHRVGRSAVLPALAVTGVLVIVGAIAAMIAVTTLAVVGCIVLGIRLLHALGLGRTKRPVAFPADNTIEGIVVNRSPADSEPSLTQSHGAGAGAVARGRSTVNMQPLPGRFRA